MNFRVGQLVRIARGANSQRGNGCPGPGTIARITRLGVNGRKDVPECPYLTPVCQLDTKPVVMAPPAWLEPYHEPGDYQTLSELLRGVVPAAKETT